MLYIGNNNKKRLCMFSTDTTAYCRPNYRVYQQQCNIFSNILHLCLVESVDANQWIRRADCNSFLLPFIYF